MSNSMTTNAERAREIAKRHALAHNKDHAYLPAGIGDEWEPHEWVVSALEEALSQARQGEAVASNPPPPNWCRTCGKLWSSPDAVFCRDPIHKRNRVPCAANNAPSPTVRAVVATPPAPVADAVRTIVSGLRDVGLVLWAGRLEAALAAQPIECIASETGRHSEDADGRTPGWCEHCSEQVEGAQPGAGDGYVLVPREATDEMVKAGRMVAGSHGLAAAWEDMVRTAEQEIHNGALD